MTDQRLLTIPRPLQLAIGAAIAVTAALVLSTGFGPAAVLAQETTTTAEETTTTAEETTTSVEETTTTAADTTTTADDATTSTTAPDDATTSTTADSDDGEAPAGGADTGAGGTSRSTNSGAVALAGLGVVVLAAGATVGLRRASAH